MTIGRQLRFMFGALHGGTLNFTLHVMSLVPIGVGLVERRWSLIALGGLLEAIGHAYDYRVRFDRDRRRQAIRGLPLQLALTVVVLVLLMAVFGWF